MRPVDWFGVAVRALGVWVLITAVDDLRTILDIRLDLFVPPREAPFAIYCIKAATHLIVGLYLLFGANHLTRLVYHPSHRGFDVLPSEVGDGGHASDEKQP